MANIEIEFYDNPSYALDRYPQCQEIGVSAFGRSIQDFGEAVNANFKSSDIAQIALSGLEAVAFGLYRISDDHSLYVNGIAVHPSYHGRGIGHDMLEEAITHTSAKTVCGITRNPAVMRLFASVSSTMFPDLSSNDTIQRAPNEDIAKVLEKIASHESVELERGFILPNKYKGNLYGGSDPGQEFSLAEITKNSSAAVVVVGLV